MAYKKQVDGIKEQFKRFRHLMHYAVRLVPLVVIVGAVAWFFVLRSPGPQDKTSGSGGAAPKTTTSATSQGAKPEAKVAEHSASTEASKENDTKSEAGKLPETGPTDTLAIFAVAATAGTLFWEWRLHRIRQGSQQL